MRHRFLPRCAAVLLACLVVLCGIFPVRGNAYDDMQPYIDEIAAFKSGGSVQDWIGGELAANAGGAAEWYVIALSQNGTYDFSAYTAALYTYVETNQIPSASSRLKYALAFAAVGEDTPYIKETLENSTGQQGIMSWIFALHLLNNGYTCQSFDRDGVTAQLLSMQLSDGGWAVMGAYSDVDVTAMTVQALAPQYWENTDVRTACDTAVETLSQMQQPYGGCQSFGTENLESTAQVVTALAALGLDAFSDPRFVKEGHSLLDGMLRFRCPDGSYAHTEGGGFNETATAEAFYTYVACQRARNGQTPLYVLDHARLPQPEPIPAETPLPTAADVPQHEEQPAVTAASDSPQTAASATETVQTTGSTAAVTEAPVTETSLTAAEQTAAPSGTLSIAASSGTTLSTQTVTAVPAEHKPEPSAAAFPAWKLWGIGGILFAAAAACIVLLLLRRRSGKNFLLIAVLALIGIGVILLLDVQSAEEYYQAPQKENAVGTVTMTIRCDTVVGKSDADYIPADGVILPLTEFPICEGDTAFTVLMDAAQAYHIQVEHDSSGYISGMAYLYELQFGELSGWMYRVNGEMMPVGCAECRLHDGDVIEWLYSCDIGNDLN